MGRQPCCDKVGLKRGPWTIEEDDKLVSFILNNGIQCWRLVPKLAGLLRCGKSCRLRWINYLRPDLKRGALSEIEENQIIQLHSHLGNRWSKIASHFPGRTDNEIKNHWNTRIKKRLKQLGLDPVTHKPVREKAAAAAAPEGGERGADIPDKKETGRPEMEMTGTHHNDAGLLNDMLPAGAPAATNSQKAENNASNTYSPSFSLEDSLNPSSMGESSSLQEGSLQFQRWVDSSPVDSLLSWDNFNPLGQELFFLENGH